MNYLTVNYRSIKTMSLFSELLINHKLNNELCEAELQSLRGRAFHSITQRFAVT